MNPIRLDRRCELHLWVVVVLVAALIVSCVGLLLLLLVLVLLQVLLLLLLLLLLFLLLPSECRWVVATGGVVVWFWKSRMIAAMPFACLRVCGDASSCVAISHWLGVNVVLFAGSWSCWNAAVAYVSRSSHLALVQLNRL